MEFLKWNPSVRLQLSHPSRAAVVALAPYGMRIEPPSRSQDQGCDDTADYANTALIACNTALIACNTALIACNTALIAGNTALIACNTALIACNTADACTEHTTATGCRGGSSRRILLISFERIPQRIPQRSPQRILLISFERQSREKITRQPAGDSGALRRDFPHLPYEEEDAGHLPNRWSPAT